MIVTEMLELLFL